MADEPETGGGVSSDRTVHFDRAGDTDTLSSEIASAMTDIHTASYSTNSPQGSYLSSPAPTFQCQTRNLVSMRQGVLSPIFVKETNAKSSINDRRMNSECPSRTMEHRDSIPTDCLTKTTTDALKAKMKQEQETSLAVTLVIIALLFICCQSVKLITDFYEMIYCSRPSSSDNSTLEQGGH